MRNHLIDELTRLAERDPRIVLLTGDLGFHVVDDFCGRFPERSFNAGISEQNMAAVAAGLALEGLVPCIYSCGSFPTLRCLEQIRNAICYHHANVKIIAVGAGFVYGQLGMSHHATEDIAAMRALPGLSIFSPADPTEAVAAIRTALSIDGPCYIRLGRGGEPLLHAENEQIDVRRLMPVREGRRIAILSTGSVISEAISAADTLKSEGHEIGLYNCISLKPFDAASLDTLAERYDILVTLEEHNVIGGLGSLVADTLAARSASDRKPRLIKLGLQDEFTSVVGCNAFLRDRYGLSAAKIVKTIQSLY